jgi:hypothetical protein
MTKYRDITREEWMQYEWIEVSTLENLAEGRKIFIRGKEITEPPGDGYVYQRVDRFNDAEYRWARCQTPVAE